MPPPAPRPRPATDRAGNAAGNTTRPSPTSTDSGLAPGPGGIGLAEGASAPPSPDASCRNAGPAYPELARALNQQGSVGLLLDVTAEGKVAAARVAQGSGTTTLDEAARRAVLGWCFRPALRDGRPVAAQFRTSVVFRLQ